MKKIIIIALSLLFALALTAQVQTAPQAFNFQGFASADTGEPIANEDISVLIEILDDQPDGIVAYTETHNLTTGSNGSFHLAVGQGTNDEESLEVVQWSEGSKYLRVSIDTNGGDNFLTIGVQQFLAVPYALFAENLKGQTGPNGPDGPQGVEGPSGPMGESGPQGPSGAVGPQGPDGDPGPQGDAGATASIGPQGPNGPPGPEGPQGPIGEEGLAGGIDGNPGVKCWDLNNNQIDDPEEDANDDGVFDVLDCRGPIGPNGADGAQGPAGNAGAAGPAGPQGPPGEPGSIGIICFPSTVPGPQGPEGPAGPPGVEGPTLWENIDENVISFTGADVGIGTDSPDCALDVAGTICANGTPLSSDRRFKQDIAPLESALSKLLAMRGVRYDFRTDEFPDKDFSSENQIGFIAQELEEVYPELVYTKADGYKAVDYAKLTPILVEALQSLYAELEEMKTNGLEVKRTRMADLQDQMTTIRSLMDTASQN